MKIKIIDGLAFVHVTLIHESKQITLRRILLDTGSTGSVFSRHALSNIGLHPSEFDQPISIRGVGGTELVFKKQIDIIRVDSITINNYLVEIGEMDYGLIIDGIIGLDLLLQIHAIINLNQLELQI